MFMQAILMHTCRVLHWQALLLMLPWPPQPRAGLLPWCHSLQELQGRVSRRCASHKRNLAAVQAEAHGLLSAAADRASKRRSHLATALPQLTSMLQTLQQA
jgi:hypothetical protein